MLSKLSLFPFFLQSVYPAPCSFPDPAVNFRNEDYVGRWFEIGKIQTKGGAFFERDCVCTELGISITNAETGDGIADNDCRDKTTDGEWTNATGSLFAEDMNKQGKWLEKIYGDPINYTVIAIDTDYSVEYDCYTNSMGVTNYCIHVLSRSRTMPEETFNKLIAEAEAMNLNPDGLPVQMTVQDGCQ